MEREDKTIFFVYGETVLERWFVDMKEAVEFAMAQQVTLERIHLKPNGSVHRMILYEPQI